MPLSLSILSALGAFVVAALLAFDLVGLENAPLWSYVPYALMMLVSLFHTVGSLVTEWIFADILSGVDFSGLFRALDPYPAVKPVVAAIILGLPFYLYHQIMHRLVDDSLQNFIHGPWLFYALIFFYLFYVGLFFMPTRAFAIETGGFFGELLVAYVLLSRAVSGRVAWHMPGEQFLHYLLGFYIPLALIHLMFLFLNGVPAEIPTLIQLEEMIRTLAADWSPITQHHIAWGFGGIAALCMVLPFLVAATKAWHDRQEFNADDKD